MAPLMLLSSLRSGGDPLDRRGSDYVSYGRLQNRELGRRRRPDDPGHLGPRHRQQFRFEPRIALEPAVVPPGGMRHGQKARMVADAIDVAPPGDRIAGNSCPAIVGPRRHFCAYCPTSRMSSRLGINANNRSRHNSAHSRRGGRSPPLASRPGKRSPWRPPRRSQDCRKYPRRRRASRAAARPTDRYMAAPKRARERPGPARRCRCGPRSRPGRRGAARAAGGAVSGRVATDTAGPDIFGKRRERRAIHVHAL